MEAPADLAAVIELDQIRPGKAGGADADRGDQTESDAQDALSGGDLGWRKSAQLPELFSDAIELLEKNQVSTPLRSGAGFHLLKLYDKHSASKQIVAQAKSRHILVKKSAILNDEEAYAKLVDIRQQILDGGDFVALAKEHSEDVGSMLSGGDLGWSLPGKFVAEFEQAMKLTAVGEISMPFRSQFGWHILQVQERREQDEG